MVAATTTQTPPNQWSQPEAYAARSTIATLLGMLITENRIDEAIKAASQALEISRNCGMLLSETEGVITPHPEIFFSGLAALRLLVSEVWLNAEDLLRKSVDVFTFLKYAGITELNFRVHGILRRRWLDLAEHHRAILTNPRLAVPEIEAAAASVPGIGGIARLIEAGRFGSSLGLANELIEMLKSTQ